MRRYLFSTYLFGWPAHDINYGWLRTVRPIQAVANWRRAAASPGIAGMLKHHRRLRLTTTVPALRSRRGTGNAAPARAVAGLSAACETNH